MVRRGKGFGTRRFRRSRAQDLKPGGFDDGLGVALVLLEGDLFGDVADAKEARLSPLPRPTPPAPQGALGRTARRASGEAPAQDLWVVPLGLGRALVLCAAPYARTWWAGGGPQLALAWQRSRPRGVYARNLLSPPPPPLPLGCHRLDKVEFFVRECRWAR